MSTNSQQNTTITINDHEFNLGIAEGCEQAKEHVSAHIANLEQKKGEVAAKLESSFLDFRKSKALRAELREAKEELLHSQRLLQSLDEKHAAISKAEEIAAAQEEIARVEKQTAALAAVCEKEIPAASRKLVVIAAALVKNRDNIQRAVDRAENAGLEPPRIPDPFKRMLGQRVYAPGWYQNLRLPLLDKSMDMLSYWPLTDLNRFPNGYQDNPKINEDVEELLSADDMLKAAKALLAKIDKRKVMIREVEEVESHVVQKYKPMWYELPISQRKRSPLDISSYTVPNKVEFWLKIEKERRKMNAFIHFLNPKEREEAMEKTPEEERQKYLDFLIEYASNDTSGEGPEEPESDN